MVVSLLGNLPNVGGLISCADKLNSHPNIETYLKEK